MEGYLLLLGAMLLLVAEFCAVKMYEKKAGVGAKPALLFNVLSGLFAAAIFFCINGLRFEYAPFSLGLAAVSALCSMLYHLIGFRMLREGKVATYTLFLMTGGMVIPYLFGVIVLDESLTWLRIVGILVVLAGMLVSCGVKELPHKKYLLMGAGVFLLNGIVGMITKLHSTDFGYRAVSSAGFVILSNLCRAVIGGLVLLILWKRSSSQKLPSMGRLLPLVVMGAGACGLSFLLQLISAQTLPATVLYPIICGGSILFSALAGRIFFKEKLSASAVVGCVLCLAGMLMFL